MPALTQTGFDMKVLLVTSPPTEVQKGGHGDDTVYITLYSIWTGIDSGPFTKYVEAIILYTFITRHRQRTLH